MNGLNPGAPVKFKGVEVGSVKRIMVRFEQTAGDVSIPVFIELDAEKLARAGVHVEFSPDAIQTAIDQGLRGRLEAAEPRDGPAVREPRLLPGDAGAASSAWRAGCPRSRPCRPTIEEAHPGREADRRAARRARPRRRWWSRRPRPSTRSRDLAGSERGEARASRASTRPSPALRELSQRLDQTIGPLGESLRTTAEETQRLEDAARQDARRRAAARRARLAPHPAARRRRSRTSPPRRARCARSPTRSSATPAPSCGAAPSKGEDRDRRRRRAAWPSPALCAARSPRAARCSRPPPIPRASSCSRRSQRARRRRPDLALGVGPVRLPGYLAVPEIQVRASATGAAALGGRPLGRAARGRHRPGARPEPLRRARHPRRRALPVVRRAAARAARCSSRCAASSSIPTAAASSRRATRSRPRRPPGVT